LRQQALDIREPPDVDALRFAVRDAGREVAIANDDRAGGDPVRDSRTEFETIGDVQKLQRVGLIVTLPLQRAADLLADRRRVFRKRQEFGAAARCAKGSEQPLRLGLLPTLIQSLERDQMA
jgi:hypothetical protein